MAQKPPGITILIVEREGLLVELCRFQKVVSQSVDVGHSDEALRAVRVVSQSSVVRRQRFF